MRTVAAGHARRLAARGPIAMGVAVLAGILATGWGVSVLLDVQAGPATGRGVRLASCLIAIGWAMVWAYRSAGVAAGPRRAAIHIALLTAGGVAGETAAAWGLPGVGLTWVAVAGGAAVWWTSRSFSAAPRWRLVAVLMASLVAAGAVDWFLVRRAWWFAATGLTGVLVLGCGFVVGLAVIRGALARATGIAAVARTVVDEAVRMRIALALVVLLIVLVPTLPLVLDHSERLEYRVQFFINWALGGTGLILALLTIFLGCGSVCGDIDSNRIHMTLVKPLERWEYLVGKWLGIVLFDLLLLGLAGAGTFTFVQLLGGTLATDEADRGAVDSQVLTARETVAPRHDRPDEYEASISAAIDQLQKDDPDAFARDPAGARRRIREEFEWVWHTVTPDKVSVYVFDVLSRPWAGGDGTIQLQLKPRVTNVDVDMADVRFAIWINDRPWPMQDGRHVEQQMTSLTKHVLDLPAEAIDERGVLTLKIENRNLVPAGETVPTAITFPPGDGLRVMRQVGGFTGNFLRCLMVTWCKLALVAAAAVASAALLNFPTAVLASLVIYFAALGSGFLRDALGEYNVLGTTALSATTERLIAAGEFAGSWRLYEAWRMMLGFVTDVVLAVLPAFSDYPAVSALATGIAIPLVDVWTCFLTIGVAYPVAIGLAGWLAFERRDLIRSLT